MSSVPPPIARPASSTIAGHRIDPGTIPLLVTLALGVFAGALDLNVLAPALHALTTDFAISAKDATLALSIYLLADVACIPIAAKYSDRLGRRPVYIACVSLFAVGSVISMAAPTYWVFLLGRAVQAAGAGGIFPVAAAAVADRIPPERRGGALGILGAIWGVAGIFGPLLGGICTAFVNWRWIFIANIPLAVIVVMLARKYVDAKPPAKRGPLDVAGLGLLTTALLGVMTALLQLDPAVAGMQRIITASIAGAVAVAAFIGLHFVERRAAEPVISPRLIARPQIALTYGLELFIGIIEGSLFFVPIAVQTGQHLNAAITGSLGALGALLFVGVIPLAGRAIDRVGARTVLSIGALGSAVGLGIFAIGYTSLPLSVLAMICAGAGFGALLGAPTRYIITSEAPPEMRSTALGLLSIFLIIGQLVGTSIAGGITGSHALGEVSFQTLYFAFAILALITCALTRLLHPHRPPQIAAP